MKTSKILFLLVKLPSPYRRLLKCPFQQVLSGKGGVGKSSITTQLALSLSLLGHSVGILDIDLTGPSIPRLLGVEEAKITQAPGGWLPVEIHPAQILPRKHEEPTSPNKILSTDSVRPVPSNGYRSFDGEHPGVKHGAEVRQIGSLHVMSLGFLLPSRSSAVVWRGPKKTAMVRQFLASVLWPPGLSYLLVDTPPGTSDEHISLAETLLSSVPASNSHHNLAGAVIVTTPQAVATSDVRKEINFCHKVGVRILGAVENMSGYVCECCGVETNLFGKGGGEAMSRECGLRFLGRVPVDVRWGALVEEGKRPVYGHSRTKDNYQDLPTNQVVNGEETLKKYTNKTLDDDANGNLAQTSENHARDIPLTSGNGATTATPTGALDLSDDNDALLVDKYRSCALYPVFKDITNTIVKVVEEQGG